MKRFGKLHKLEDGKYQLQYWERTDVGYQVTETQTIWKEFETEKELEKLNT